MRYLAYLYLEMTARFVHLGPFPRAERHESEEWFLGPWKPFQREKLNRRASASGLIHILSSQSYIARTLSQVLGTEGTWGTWGPSDRLRWERHGDHVTDPVVIPINRD